MAETKNIKVIPGGASTIVYVSQNDVGRPIVFNVKDENGWYDLTGKTVKFVGTKPSGLGFTVSATVSGHTATISTTKQMTDEYGIMAAELRITSGDDVIGTANAVLNVEQDPHPEGTTDGSTDVLIPELTVLVERVEAAAASVLDMQVEVDTLAPGADATYSYDEDTNTATFGIPRGINGDVAPGNIASNYSSSATYAVGDYVWYNSTLYRCTTAITTAEAWTAGHWTAAELAGDVSDAKNDINVLGYSLSVNPSKTQPNLFIQNTNKQAYNNSTEGFTVKAFKVEKGKRYSCYGKSLATYTSFAYSLVMMGVVYGSDITLASGTVYTFDYSVGSNAQTTPSNYDYTFTASNDGFIVVMDIASKYVNYVFAEQDIASIRQTTDALKYCSALNADITAPNLFIYDVSKKLFADSVNGFTIKAYRIKKGYKYSCYGNAIGSFSSFRYQVVVMGVSYVDAISLVTGATLSFTTSYASPSEYSTPPNYSYEFVADDDGFIIMTDITNVYVNSIFGEGSADESYEKVNKATTLFDASFDASEFKALNSWSVGTEKITTSTNGLGNRATINKSFSIENRATYIRFKTSDSSAKIGFGYESPAYAYESTLCYADFSAGKIAICEAYSTLSSMPSDRAYKNVTLNANREYIAILDKDKKRNTFTLVDTLSGNRYSVSTVDNSTDTLNNEFAGGRQNGYPFVSLLSGSNAEVVEWYITTPFYEPRIALYGDSITEGDRLTNNAKRFADWLKGDFGFYDVSVSGMSGSNIDTLTAQVEAEIGIVKPQIVIVQVGTNGTNTSEKLLALKATIEANGSIAIFNHIPMISGASVEARNEMIDAIGTEHCLMDVATSVNNLAVTQNATLYADGAHPNEIGHSAMYKRFVIDTSIYHN